MRSRPFSVPLAAILALLLVLSLCSVRVLALGMVGGTSRVSLLLHVLSPMYRTAEFYS